MGSKNKGKSTGKRKTPKVSLTKLSNKRLTKLAKQGKLKNKLSKGKYIEILKQRTGKGKDVSKENGADPEFRASEKDEEKDIPVEEADYEYFAKNGRDYAFLTNLPDNNIGHKKRRKKPTPVEDDTLETTYEQSGKQQLTQERKALLPIKDKEGIIPQSMEVKEEQTEETEDANDERAEAKPLPTLTPAQLLKQRKTKLENAKQKIAVLSSAVLENPEESISKLKELRLMLDEQDADVCVTTRKFVSLSLLEVFKDIIPGYRIRVATEKEKQQTAKKDTKKLRDFEEGLVGNYKHYLEFLESMAKGKPAKPQNKQLKLENGFQVPPAAAQGLRDVALHCLCELLTTHPHFNFRTNIIGVIIPFMSNKGSAISDKMCSCVRKLFQTDKTGEVALEVVRLIGRMIKARNFTIEPKVLDTFLSLKIREIDMGDGKEETTIENKAARREKFRKMSRRDRKRSKQMKVLEKELEDAALQDNKKSKLKLHTETMKLVFLTYFRILKQAPDSVLLSSVLEGLAKFAHLISIDFFDDLFNVLNDLVASDELSYRESLHCVQTAFTILMGQGDVFNIDPLNFYRHLYKTLFYLHAGRTSEDVSIAVDCLQIMIGKRKRQVSHQRLLSFIKRLSSLCLQLPHHGALSILASVRNFIHADSRSQVLYDTESHGSGIFLPELEDPEHANAANTALYELHILRHHYHPAVRQYSEHVLRGAPSTGAGQLPPELSRRSASELFEEFSPKNMEFNPTTAESPSAKKQAKASTGELKQNVLKETIHAVQQKMTDVKLGEIDFEFRNHSTKLRKRKYQEKKVFPRKKTKHANSAV